MILLKTERLIIRDPVQDDLPAWHKLLSNEHTMYYLQDIMTHSEEESRQNLATAISDICNPNRTKYFFSIELKSSGDFIGSIGYTVTENTPIGKLVWLGYFILPEYHGKGYTTEALNELIRFSFEENGVFRISTGCLAENHRSERVMNKCGFIKEAEFKAFVWHDGHMKDRVEYRLLKDDWLSDNKKYSPHFWQALDKLVTDSKITIDRPKGSRHPKYPSLVYPVDYGYLKNTSSMDGGGIDVWLGTNGNIIDAIICTLDLLKRDSEMKILIGCSEEEKRLVMGVHNESEYMKGILIRRDL